MEIEDNEFRLVVNSSPVWSPRNASRSIPELELAASPKSSVGSKIFINRRLSSSESDRHSSNVSQYSGERPWHMKRVNNVSAFFNGRGRKESYEGSDDSYDCSTDSDVEWSRRIIPRDTAFHQASGAITIDQTMSGGVLPEIYSLYSDDWFHRTLTQRTYVLLIGVLVIYTCFTLVFASIYVSVNEPDPADPCCLFEQGINETQHQYYSAFAFALETSVTTGYTLPGFIDGTPTSAFWVNCPKFTSLVWAQACIQLVFNAMLFSLVISRCGRADIRSKQIVFSDKACITYLNGKFYFSYQMFDLQTNAPTIEASTRAYVIFNASDGHITANFQTRAMRIQNPDDELGSDLFLGLPCHALHHIDQWSPLLPPTMRREHWHKHNDNFVHNPANRYQYPHMSLREVDSEIGSRDSASCPVCGSSFASDEHLLRHIRYQKYIEELDESESDDQKEEAAPVTTPPPRSKISTTGSLKSIRRGDSSHSRHSTRSSRIKEKLKAKGRRVGHSHKTVKTGGGKTSVDAVLKSLADMSLTIGHGSLPLEALSTKNRVITEDELQDEILRDRNLSRPSSIFRKSKPADEIRDRIQNFIEASELEIVVLVEGIEPRTSDTFQARHSYTVDDIVFDEWFEPCVLPDANGVPTVDLDRFHMTREVLPGEKVLFQSMS